MATEEFNNRFLSSLIYKSDKIEQIREEFKSTVEEDENKACVDSLDTLRDILKDLKNRTEKLISDNKVLRIGIVGQVKAGKSSFLNAMFFDGDDILPKAATPMTAGLTILKYGEENGIEIEYFNRAEWDSFKKRDEYFKSEYRKAAEGTQPRLTEAEFIQESMISDDIVAAHELVNSLTPEAARKIKNESEVDSVSFSTHENMHRQLAAYVGASGVFTPVVKSLILTLNDERLKDLEIVDTPGVNDPVVSREQRTHEFLSQCHGVFFLSFTGSFFGETDVTFLENRIGQQGISKVVVIGSKFDSALLDASMKYPDDLGGAINYVIDGNRNQMMQNLQNTPFADRDIPLESSSAISFEIAKKYPNLNAEQKNIYDLMRRSYPSVFSDPEEAVGYFMELSQVEEIWNNYVENDFKKSKDAIIAAKIADFVSKNEKTLTERINAEIDKLSTRIEALEKGGLGDLRSQKQGIEDATKVIESEIRSLVTQMEAKSKAECRSIKNQYQFFLSSLPRERKIYSASRLTTFWKSRTTFEVSCDSINSNALSRAVDELVEKNKKQIISNWSTHIDKQYKEIDKALRDTLDSSVDKIGDSLELRLILNVIKETLSTYSEAGMIDLQNLGRYQSELRNIIQRNEFNPPSLGSMDEEDAMEKVKDHARKCMDRIKAELDEKLSEMQDYVFRALDKAAQNSTDVLSTRRRDFINSIMTQVQKELNEINEDLKNGEENIRQLKFVRDRLKKEI